MFYPGAVLAAGISMAALTWFAVGGADSQTLSHADDQRFGQLSYEVTSKVEHARADGAEAESRSAPCGRERPFSIRRERL